MLGKAAIGPLVMPCQAMSMVVVHVASGTRDILIFWATWPRLWATPYTPEEMLPMLSALRSWGYLRTTLLLMHLATAGEIVDYSVLGFVLSLKQQRILYVLSTPRDKWIYTFSTFSSRLYGAC
jgi:hypothetical protein